ncbi:hypothetical protein RJ55_01996 [Drechmeria coniospora]|nr:hypothetical protein RJ55_01996 [Drechmeria coniospora]
MLSLLLALLAAPVAGNMLHRYRSDKLFKRTCHKFCAQALLSDHAHPWPLNERPWEFAPRIVREACWRSESACWVPGYKVPAMLHLGGPGDSPEWRNMTVTVEGVFDPSDERRTKGSMLEMMTLLLKAQHVERFTKYLKPGIVRTANGTGMDRLAIYSTPQSFGVTIGRHGKDEPGHSWLSVQLNTDLNSIPMEGLCARFIDTPSIKILVRTLRRRSEMSRCQLGYVECLHRAELGKPDLSREEYVSPATKILLAEELERMAGRKLASFHEAEPEEPAMQRDEHGPGSSHNVT